MIAVSENLPEDHRLVLEYLHSLRETVEIGEVALSLTNSVIKLSNRIAHASPEECVQLSETFIDYRRRYFNIVAVVEEVLKRLEAQAKACRASGGKPSWEITKLQLDVLSQELEMRKLDDELKTSTLASYHKLKSLGLLRFNSGGRSKV